MIVCAQKRAKYALGEPKLDVKDIIYVCEKILSHLLADAEARSLVSDSFPKMHINNKINVSVKAMCRVAAKKLCVCVCVCVCVSVRKPDLGTGASRRLNEGTSE